MRPADIAALRPVGEPRVHPDGTRVAFVVARADLDEDRYERRIWRWDGQGARPFTAGPGDGTPRWSPDGRHLAFVRKADDEQPQLAVMPADGGEAEVVTDLALGVEALAWAPDSQRIVVAAGAWLEELADLEEDERERRPRRIDRRTWRFDNRGWLHDRRSHLYLVDPTGDHDPVLVTAGDFDESEPVWHPDGSGVAFLSARHDERDLDPGTQAWFLPIDGWEAAGKPEALTEVGAWSHVSYRPDGAVHLVGHPDPWSWPVPSSVWRRDDDGSLTDLTGHLDRDVTASGTAEPAGPQWVDDERFLITLEDRGSVGVVRVDATGAVERLVTGRRWVAGVHGVAPDRFAFVADAPTAPGGVHWWEGGDERRVTDLDPGLDLVEPEYLTIEHDGGELDVWVYLPPGDEPVPLLLNVHGGPAAQYGWTFFDEFQVYAGAGYGVVATNPRGSSGRGRDFVRAVVDRWADAEPPDLADLRATVDATLERFPRLDAARIGIMGGSYGGFATARIIAEDHRFTSAVVERGLLSWISFAGTSDIGAAFDRLYLHAQLPEDADTLWRASPVAHAHRTTTPTLVLHSEHDFRCPIEQAEQYFSILRRHGIETEFLRFPGESHELSRSGKPKHRIERFEAILDWHSRHLREART